MSALRLSWLTRALGTSERHTSTARIQPHAKPPDFGLRNKGGHQSNGLAHHGTKKAIKQEHAMRDGLIDLIPFKRSVVRGKPAYQAAGSWNAAAANVAETYFRERKQSISLPDLVEAISYIELGRQLRSGAVDGAAPLRRCFSHIRCAKDVDTAAVNSFLRAVSQHTSSAEVRQSWADAGMGYVHRKDQLFLSGVTSIIGLAQALCPEPTGKIVLAAARCAMAFATLYKCRDIGAQRVYYKLTDELIPLGLTDATPSLRDAPYPLAAAWQLPGHARLSALKAKFAQALRAAHGLNAGHDIEIRNAAFAHLSSVQDEYRILRDAVDRYKATSYASQIEWAGYRQRMTTLGGAAALVTGTAVGIALAGGPYGAAAGLAIGMGVSLPLWAASHLTYHFRGWKAPDNRDKIERALLTMIKSPDLHDQTKTSVADLAVRFVQYKNALLQAQREGVSTTALQARFAKEVTPLLNLKLIDAAWRRTIDIRLTLGKKILVGKFALAVDQARALVPTTAQLPEARKNPALENKKDELKSLWSDLANVEIFMKHATLSSDDGHYPINALSKASKALENIVDPDFRNLLSGNLEKQMNAGEKAKHLTKGEMTKYQLTYFVGSMLGDMANIGLTLPSLVASTCLNEPAPLGSSQPDSSDSNAYRSAGAASLVASANAAEVSGGRALFEKETDGFHQAFKSRARVVRQESHALTLPISNTHAEVVLTSNAMRSGFRASDVPDQAVDDLVRMGEVPQSVALFQKDVRCGAKEPVKVDLTTTEPFWKAQRSRLCWTEKMKPAGAAVWVGMRYLGLSLAGLGHRMCASGISLRASRMTRRELEALDDAATKLLATNQASHQPRETENASAAAIRRSRSPHHGYVRLQPVEAANEQKSVV